MSALLPEYLAGATFWRNVWPLVTLPVLISLAVAYAITRQSKPRPKLGLILLPLLAFSLLGIVTGNITGLSRSPAVGTVLPALLALLGGVFAYVVGTQEPKKQLLVSGGLITLTVCLLVGLHWGGRSRVVFEFQSKEYESALVAANSSASEETAFAVALKRLQFEIEFAQVKEALEAKHGKKFVTAYPTTNTSPAPQKQ